MAVYTDTLHISALPRVATIETIDSSTRIEGRLSDSQVERLLANLDIQPFRSRGEQEVAGHAHVMETQFASLPELSLRIPELARERGRISIAEAVILAGANRNTVKKHLAHSRIRGN